MQEDRQSGSVQDGTEKPGIDLGGRDADQDSGTPPQVAGQQTIQAGDTQKPDSGSVDISGGLPPAPADTTVGKSPSDFISCASLRIWNHDFHPEWSGGSLPILATEQNTCKFLEALSTENNILSVVRYKNAFSFDFQSLKVADAKELTPEQELKIVNELVGPKFAKEIAEEELVSFFEKNPVKVVYGDKSLPFYVMFNDLDDPFIKEEEDAYEVVIAICMQLKGKLGASPSQKAISTPQSGGV